MKRFIIVIAALICTVGISPNCLAENDFSIEGSVMNVHLPDGNLYTFIDIAIGSDFPGQLPDDVDSITVTGPGGQLPYTKDDFTYFSQWGEFFIGIPGSPEAGMYSFSVVMDNLSASATDIQEINRTIPIPDASMLTFSNRTFSWGSVDYPGVTLYYRLEICDTSGWRIFATSREANLLSYTLPDGILEPGKEYQWRVRVTDSDTYIDTENRSNSEWVDITTSACNVMNLHGSDGGYYTSVSLDIGDDLPGTPPDNISSITATAPSGQLSYNKEDFTYNSQWKEFSLKIPGSPEIGEYSFIVTGNSSSGVSVTLTDTQSVNLDIPVPDISTFTFSDGTFSWGSVDYPGVTLYYRLEICDTSGWRIFATSREANLLSYTLPDGILESGETYKWRVRVTDSNDWLSVQNRSNSDWITLAVESSNSPPEKPILLSPTDGEINVSLTPLFQTGEFHDPDEGDTHLKTELDISETSDFTVTVFYRSSTIYLTSVTLPKFILREETTYHWRVRFYDNHGNVSEWSDAYSFTTLPAENDENSNGIPDDRENISVDLDNDGTADIEQNDIKSLDTVTGGQIGVSRAGDTNVTAIDCIDSIDPTTISDIARPSNMTLGMIAARLFVANAGDRAEVVVYFSEAAPAGAVWLMHNSISGWTDYSAHATFSADRMSVTLEYKDGDYGDSDGVANRTIVDPGGFGLASWVTGRVYNASTGEGISQAEVDIEGGLSLQTDLDGYYISLILPGTYNVSVSATDYETFNTSVEISEGDTITQDIGMTSLSQPANPIYFPHIDTADPWETEMAMINTSSTQTAAGTLNTYSDSGTLIDSMEITLNPNARKQINISQELTDPDNIGYIIFNPNTDTIEGYTKFYQQGKYRVAVPAVKTVNTSDIYVSHIASDDQWWTGLSLLNTTSGQKELTIRFSTGETGTKTLSANGHEAFTIASLFGDSKPAIQSAVIENADGIVGLELFGSAGDGNQLSGILLKDATASTIYYPHIASDEIWWTGIVAYNPSGSSADITITPYTDTGNALTLVGPISIGAGEKYIGAVAALSFPSGAAWLKIDSTNPITGFELFGTVDGKQLGGYTGIGISGKDGIFAKIEQQGWTGIAFVNIENSQASITLAAYDNNGNTIATQLIALAGYAKTVDKPENIFTQNIDSATYIGYSSDRNIVGFQLNGSSDNMMLDGLPGM